MQTKLRFKVFQFTALVLLFAAAILIMPGKSLAALRDPAEFTWTGTNPNHPTWWQTTKNWTSPTINSTSESPGNGGGARDGNTPVMTDRAVLVKPNAMTGAFTIEVCSDDLAGIFPLDALLVENDVTLELGYPIYSAGIELENASLTVTAENSLVVTRGTATKKSDITHGPLKFAVFKGTLAPIDTEVTGFLSMDKGSNTSMSFKNFVATVNDSGSIALTDSEETSGLFLNAEGDTFSVAASQVLTASADISAKTLTLNGALTASGAMMTKGTLVAGEQGFSVIAGNSGLTLQNTLTLPHGSSMTVKNGELVTSTEGLTVSGDLISVDALTVKKALTVNGTMSAQGSVSVDNGAKLTAGVLTSPNLKTLTLAGSGTIVATNKIENNGTLAINGPKLEPTRIVNSTGHEINIAAIDSASSITTENSGTLNFNANDNANVGTWTITAKDSSSINFNGVYSYTAEKFALAASDSSTLTVNSNLIANKENFIITGSGRLLLKGTGTFTGTLNLDSVNLIVGKTNPIQSVGATLNISGDNALIEVSEWGTKLGNLHADSNKNATIRLADAAQTSQEAALNLETLKGENLTIEFSDAALRSLVALSRDVTPILTLLTRTEDNIINLENTTPIFNKTVIDGLSLDLSLSRDKMTLCAQLIAESTDEVSSDDSVGNDDDNESGNEHSSDNGGESGSSNNDNTGDNNEGGNETNGDDNAGDNGSGNENSDDDNEGNDSGEDGSSNNDNTGDNNEGENETSNNDSTSSISGDNESESETSSDNNESDNENVTGSSGDDGTDNGNETENETSSDYDYNESDNENENMTGNSDDDSTSSDSEGENENSSDDNGSEDESSGSNGDNEDDTSEENNNDNDNDNENESNNNKIDSDIINVEIKTSFDLDALSQKGITGETRTVIVEIDGQKTSVPVLFLSSAPDIFPITVTSAVLTLNDGTDAKLSQSVRVYCCLKRGGSQEISFDVTSAALNGGSFDLAPMIQSNDEFELFFQIVRPDVSQASQVLALHASHATSFAPRSVSERMVIGDGRLFGVISPDKIAVTRKGFFEVSWRNAFVPVNAVTVTANIAGYSVMASPTVVSLDLADITLTPGDYSLAVHGHLVSNDTVSTDIAVTVTVLSADADITGLNFPELSHNGGCNAGLGALGLALAALTIVIAVPAPDTRRTR